MHWTFQGFSERGLGSSQFTWVIVLVLRMTLYSHRCLPSQVDKGGQVN